jgi:hypothetical protein
MADDTPTRIAMWMLERFASAHYRESLAGDLIEQLACGRSRAWVWRQVLAAVAIAPLSALRRAPWMAAIKAALLALGLITLGIGTMSWASDRQSDTCTAPSCRHAAHGLER